MAREQSSDIHRRRRRGVLRATGMATAAFALVVAPTGAALAADPPPSTPLERVQALVQPAVVYEEMTWSGAVYDRTNEQYFADGQQFTVSFQCTGFVVNPEGYVATAGHCVDYDATIDDAIKNQAVDWAFENDYYQVKPSKRTIASFKSHWRVDGEDQGKADLSVSVAYGVSVSGEPSGKALPARVLALRGFTEGDVALLKIDAKDLTVAGLSNNENTGVGTQIVAIGYPASVDLVTDENFNPSFKEGTISAEKTTSGGLLPVYEISAAVSGGMSGGPTVGLEGDVIGVNSFKITGETQAFNFVQPSGTLQELMRAEGVENTLGKVTDLYRAGLTAYFAGDKTAATESFQQVLNIVPSHQFAQEYLRKAQDLPESGSSLLPILLIVGGLVLLALLVGGVLLLARRGKRTPAPGGSEAAIPAQAMTAPITPERPQASEPAPPSPAPSSFPPPAPEPVPPPAPAPEPVPPPAPAPESAPPPPAPEPVPPPPAPVAPAPQPLADLAPEEPAGPEAGEPEHEPEEEPEHGRFCPNCGKPHAPEARFCPHCGHSL